jgi:hypothetical protein
MVADNIESTPIAIWNWAMENDFVEPNYRSDDLIYLHLLPRDKGTVQKGGVLFKGIYYTCDMAIGKKWFAIARSRGVWSIDCWYDPNSAAHIWIQDDDKQFVRCNLRRSDSKYAVYRTDEIYDMLEAYRQIPPAHKRAELESRISLHEEIDQVVSQALSEKTGEPAPMTKTEKVGNIRDNRSEERNKERATAFVPEGVRSDNVNKRDDSASETSGHYAGVRSAQVIDMLKRLRPGSKK